MPAAAAAAAEQFMFFPVTLFDATQRRRKTGMRKIERKEGVA
jgi:hypothetical protein